MASADVQYGQQQFRCFVGGLSFNTVEDDLGRTFENYGKVMETKIIMDRETGRSRGFGFVTFETADGMEKAIEALNGRDIDGRNVTVNQAQERSRENGGGGSRGGGYGQREGYGNRREGGGYRGGRGYGNGGRGYGGGYRGSDDRGYGGDDSRGYGGSDRSGYGGGEKHGYGGGQSGGYGGGGYRSGGAPDGNWRD
ncbi:unnamed protein product [Cuscuta europaea]|uniref:RRM domain-containing protein n=1 Tax=Cuscuta europaea TaxID=41803 RepID=A0A9P1EE48_CUSEU|nr:unnamed protein product [Cuscuta europaea]